MNKRIKKENKPRIVHICQHLNASKSNLKEKKIEDCNDFNISVYCVNMHKLFHSI